MTIAQQTLPVFDDSERRKIATYLRLLDAGSGGEIEMAAKKSRGPGLKEWFAQKAPWVGAIFTPAAPTQTIPANPAP